MLKQIKYILPLTAVFLAFFGCSYQSDIQPAEPVFTFDSQATIYIGDQTYSGRIIREYPVGTKVILEQPQELSGMAWFWDGEGFSVSYEGLEVDREEYHLPDGSFAAVLVETLDAAAAPSALTTAGEGAYYGSVDGQNFTLVAEPSTGRLLYLEVPEKDFKASFHETES